MVQVFLVDGHEVRVPGAASAHLMNVHNEGWSLVLRTPADSQGQSHDIAHFKWEMVVGYHIHDTEKSEAGFR